MCCVFFFFFKQKTAYEIKECDWSSDVCSSDLIFVIETFSVIIQVTSFKLTGKRVFKMAPIHHHFEEKGWPEPKVIVRFWIAGIILALLGLASLKVR